MCTTATYRIFISIHSLRMEGDRQKFQDIAPKIGISIHSLRMEGDFTHVHFIYGISHFNPLPPHGGRRLRTHGVHNKRKISIHSLHTEGDIYHVTVACTRRISIHSLHTEGDGLCTFPFPLQNTFQSTPSTRRETCPELSHPGQTHYFNPLPPHGGRLASLFSIFIVAHFNPLPPHGGRRIVLFWIAVLWHFNPLPPHGGRPTFLCTLSYSPHHFNPLPPHGGRLPRIRQRQ